MSTGGEQRDLVLLLLDPSSPARSAAMDAGVVVDSCSPSQLLLYPPPLNLTDYEKKPLPALPPTPTTTTTTTTTTNRRSLASSFRSEVDHAFTTPHLHDGCPLIFEWEREGSGKSVRLSQSPVYDDDDDDDDDEVTRLRPRKKRQPASTRSLARARARQTLTSHAGASSYPVLPSSTAPADPPAKPRLRRTLSAAAAAAAAGDLLVPPSRQTLPRLHSYKLPPVRVQVVPPDEILSPQPRSSVQKILRLTGSMNPGAGLSQDTPSLHNSSQKIRQLTGLDVGPHPLHPVEEEASAAAASAASSDASSSSSYSLAPVPAPAPDPEVPEDYASYEPAESVYSPSYAESVNEVLTPLTVPRYINPVAVPRHIPDERANESSVAAALRLSGFVAVGASLAPPEPEPPTVPTVREAPPSPPDSTYHRRRSDGDGDDGDDAASVASSAASSSSSSAASSSSDESASALELEPTTGMLYHDTAISIARSMGGNSSPPPPPAGTAADVAAVAPAKRSRGPRRRSKADPSSSSFSASARPFSLSIFRKREAGLSERRGRGPARLEGVVVNRAGNHNNNNNNNNNNTPSSAPSAAAPSSSTSWKQQQASSSSSAPATSQRTPYPPVSSTIRGMAAVQEADQDGQARLSLLARIFTGGSSSTGGGGGGARRGSGPPHDPGPTGGPSSGGDATAAPPPPPPAPPAPPAGVVERLEDDDDDDDDDDGEGRARAAAPASRSAWSPETPEPPGAPSDEGGGPAAAAPGILSRTLDHARHAAGLRTRAERAEQKRETLRGKIRVLRSPAQNPRASMTDDGSL